ncbi:MAG: tetratricopeptide repeat protein [Caldilineaceae bacterium]
MAVDPDPETLALVSLIRAGSFDRVTAPQELSRPEVKIAGEGDTKTGGQDDEMAVSSSHPVIQSSNPPLPLHNLPGQRTPFVGRATEVADIQRLLTEDDCRLLTIVGPGGMGKTRLALKAAEELVASPAFAQHFGDGIYFVPLENVNDGNGLVAAIIAAITEEGGQRLRMDVPLQEQLVYFLRAKSRLLLLDNFEHLLHLAGMLSDLLVAVPQIKLLVTARETVGLQEAWYYPLLGLSIPQPGLAAQSVVAQQKPQHEYDAVRLFVQCARRTRPDFALDAQRAAVLKICTLVEGMPLGIELAAAWLKVMDCPQIAQELAHGLDFLTARYQNIPPRHRSMRVVMDHSWALLSEEEGRAIARLSTFRGRFRHEAARTITGASLLTLAALVEKALVRVTPDGHYQLHELTRQYAAERLTGAEHSHLRDAHATYYAELLQQQQPRLYTRDEHYVWTAMGSELDNIRHGWDWLIVAASAGRQDLPVPLLLHHMAEPLAAYYLFQSPGLPGQTLFGNACDALTAAGWATADANASEPYTRQALLVHLQLYLGAFHFDSGHYRTSLAVAEQALATCRALALEEDLLLALLLYGRTQMRRGAADAAVQSLQEALVLAQHLGSTASRAEALITLGIVASNMGHYIDAQTYLQQALGLAHEMGYRPWVARILTNLGTTYSRQHDYSQAQPYYEQALTIAREEGDQNFIMINTSNLGGVYRGFGQHSLSVDYFQRSLAMARGVSDARWIVANLNGMSMTYLDMGDLPAAERALHEALAVGQQSDSTTDTLGSVALLGNLFARRGRMETALNLLAFAEQHPATMARDLLYSQPLLTELRSELAPLFFKQAANWAMTQTLDSVVQWLLYEKNLWLNR